MRINDALDRFITQLRADGRSDHTVRQYQRHVRALRQWLTDESRPDLIAAITHEVVAAFLVSPAAGSRPDGAAKKATSTNALRSSLRGFFGYLHKAGYIATDPTRLVRRARCAPPPPRALSEDEHRRLVAALDGAETDVEQRDAMLIRLLLGTGVRIGSALGLDVDDVDLDGATMLLRSTKGDRPMRAIVPASLVPYLRAYVAKRAAGPLFPGTGARGRLSARHAQRRFTVWLERAGVQRHASLHALRHTLATGLYRRTGDIALVQAALGHRAIASTMIYARVDEDRLRAAMG